MGHSYTKNIHYFKFDWTSVFYLMTKITSVSVLPACLTVVSGFYLLQSKSGNFSWATSACALLLMYFTTRGIISLLFWAICRKVRRSESWNKSRVFLLTPVKQRIWALTLWLDCHSMRELLSVVESAARLHPPSVNLRQEAAGGMVPTGLLLRDPLPRAMFASLFKLLIWWRYFWNFEW